MDIADTLKLQSGFRCHSHVREDDQNKFLKLLILDGYGIYQ